MPLWFPLELLSLYILFISEVDLNTWLLCFFVHYQYLQVWPQIWVPLSYSIWNRDFKSGDLLIVLSLIPVWTEYKTRTHQFPFYLDLKSYITLNWTWVWVTEHYQLDRIRFKGVEIMMTWEKQQPTHKLLIKLLIKTELYILYSRDYFRGFTCGNTFYCTDGIVSLFLFSEWGNWNLEEY